MKWFASLILALALGGCAQLGLTPPQTFTEKVAYVEAGAQGAITTLAGLTCLKYTAAGECTTAGRPLHPARSDGYLNTLSKVRQATKAAGSMPAIGGQCLGQPSTPLACLALATTMLGEVQKILTDLKGR